MGGGYVVTVEGCSRCGERHADLSFQEFVKPPNYVGLTLTHWALCPTTGEPLLLRPASIEDGRAGE